MTHDGEVERRSNGFQAALSVGAAEEPRGPAGADDRQDGQTHAAAPENSCMSFLGPAAGHSEAVCDYCHRPMDRGTRGPRATMHPECRERFWKEARKAGAQIVRRRRARVSQPPRPRRRRTPDQRAAIAFSLYGAC